MNGTKSDHPVSNGHKILKLPASSSPAIQLTHPTQEEAEKQIRDNGVSWRGALSLEAYIRREAHLANQDLTKGDGLTRWALVENPSSESRRLLCACETLKKKALVARKGVIKETVAHGVGSVFCPPAHRGKGYAGRMMKDLGEELRTWQSEDKCLISILYSDIGKTFYANSRWMPFPSAHVFIPAGRKDTSNIQLPRARALKALDIPRLCAIDEILIRRSLEQETSSSDNTFVAIIPDINTIKWHHAREEFVGKELHGKAPEVKGAIVGDTEGERAWCYWTRMWYNEDASKREENSLHILRLVVESKTIIDWEKTDVSDEDNPRFAPLVAALLEMAAHEAEEWGTEGVEVWNPNAVTLSAAQLLDPSATLIERESESITSLRWYGQQEELEKLVWLGNEKYGWC